MRTDYACSSSEDKVTMGCLAKGYFQDGTRDEALARTQVYLSKTKLKLEI